MKARFPHPAQPIIPMQPLGRWLATPAQAGIQYFPDMVRHPTVYILASGRNGTLYVGVTSDPVKRVWEHRQGLVDGFTKKYRVQHLVYFEQHETMEEGIVREKQIKKWNRTWKLHLIEEGNPEWRDLCLEISGSGSPPARE